MGQEYECSVPRFKYLAVQLNLELSRGANNFVSIQLSTSLRYCFTGEEEKDHIIQILFFFGEHIIQILFVKYSSTHQSLIPVLDVAANQSSCIRIHKLHYNTEHGIPDTVNFTSKIS